MRFRGTLIGFFSGALVGGLLVLALGPSREGAALARAIVLAPLLGLCGLLLDVLLVVAPDLWRTAHPGRLWLSHPFKIVLFWTICYPLVRLAQDALTVALLSGGAELSGANLAPFTSPPGLLAFLLFQSVFATAYGIGFVVLYRVTGGR